MSRREAFYHGTNVELQPGDRVLPARVTGNHHTHSGTSYAWATTDPSTADLARLLS